MKRFALASFLFALICGFAFGYGKAPATVVGHINFYGNAPVEFPGIVTVDGQTYGLKIAEGSAFTLKEISSHQGELLELTGEIENPKGPAYQRLKDGFFIVSEWKVLK
ncbi:MAG: hypothetical protein KBT11_02340 [Treponema sp.]|nr:hypothetical protein [Candidatus Treponema equifaecale]